LGRSETGGYPGSIGQDLSREERTAIRRALAEAKEPLHLTAIAGRAAVDLTSPHKQQNLREFVEVFLCETSKECQMAFAKNRRGVDVFAGWEATPHGREMVEKGLA
jgi:hypothetical protein